MRWGLFRKILLAIFLSLPPVQAYAQTTQEELPAPVGPSWNAAAGDSATPDGACRLSHQYFNPNAPYSPPTYNNEISYSCHWLARQQGGPPESNTILANIAILHCPEGHKPVNGICKDVRTESTVCDACDAARSVSAPKTPMAGNPVSITTGYKVQDELDYSSADGLFQVKRRHVSTSYRRDYLPQVSFGETWQGIFPGRLKIHNSIMSDITWFQGNGESFHLFYSADKWNGNNWDYIGPDGSRAKLAMASTPSVTRSAYFQEAAVLNGPGEFRLSFGNGEYILFRRATAQPDNRDAVPVEHGYANGYKRYFDYADTGLFPYRVRDSFGRQLLLTWVDTPNNVYDTTGIDATRKAIKTIALPDGTTLTYDYDQANGQVTGTWTDTGPATVTIPGRKDRLTEARRTNASGQVIWKRTYLYEDNRWPYALTGIKDRDGTRLSTYSYNVSGLVASSERAGGVDRHEFRQYRKYEFGSINESYLYNEVTNPLGHKETYKLYQHVYWKPPQLPRLIMQVDGAASANVPADTMPITYTNNTMISSVTDKKGALTSYGLDTANLRPTSITEAQGTPNARTTTITWHPTFDLPTKLERTGLKVEHTYSAIGQMLTRTETDTTTQSVPYSTAGQTRTWTYNWEASGRLGSINGPKPVDAQGKDDTDSFTYDTAGNLLTSTNGLGHVTTFAGYDANGLPASMTDANGIVTEFSYDALGRATAIRVRHPSDAQLDAVTSFEYDLESRVIGLTQPATDKLIFDYNVGGQLTAIRMASGERIDFTNDKMGNVTAMTVKRADGSPVRSIARTFDELGRTLTETLGQGRTTKWTYDKNGNATQAVSARNGATQAAFDPLNRLVSTVAPDAGTTATAYNAIDAVTSFTDPITVQTTFVRNGFGEVIQEVSPDRGTSTYYYNEGGERTAAIDGRGQRVDYTRDILGRVTSKTPVGQPGQAITYSWDTAGISGSYGVGRLASVTDASGTTSFAYDHRGNLLTKRQTIGSGTADLSYAYDLADRISQITYPSGRLVAYTRDTKGRVVQVSTKGSASDPSWTALASSITYDPWGSMTAAQFGNGLSLAQVWTDGRLASKRLYSTGSGTNLSSLAYAYDASDNIGAIRDLVDDSRSAFYGYDANDRMTFASIAVGTPANDTESFGYTAGKNRLASVASASGTRSISYDGRGNTLGETRPGGASVSVTYDGYGRLLTYTRTGDPAQTNQYNGLDDRVSVDSAGTTRIFVYDPDGRVIGEYACPDPCGGGTSAAVVAETIWLQPEVANDNGPLGGDDGVGGYAPLATGSGTSAALYWVHGNHLGVPLVTTDASGAVATPTGYTLPGYPGQQRTLADLYYNRHRDYDSSTGRYIQADPIGLEGGSNPYLYAEGNPLRFTDPDGLAAVAALTPFFAADAATPEPTDLAWPKWAGWACAFGVAGAVDWVLESRRKGERNWAGKPDGTPNPSKGIKGVPGKPGWGQRPNPQTGKKGPPKPWPDDPRLKK
jgi:RHS repeat-associated protein